MKTLIVESIGLSETANPADKEAAMTAYNIGTYYMRENKFNDAEKYLKEAVDLDASFIDAIDHLGFVYRRQNRLEEAEKIYLKSIKLNDKNKVPFINLAVICKLQGRMDEAVQLYSYLIQILPNDPEGYYGLGEVFYITGHDEKSIQFFDMALKLYMDLNSPLVYDVFFYKGLICYRNNKYDEALKYLEEARKGNPNNETLENTIYEIKNS
jgi:tetratricopeptide (TPR) repeat protein